MNGDFSGSQLVFVSGISADPGGSQLFLLLGIRDPSAIRCPRLRQTPQQATMQELPPYYVEVEAILCGSQMNQMSCIEQTLLQTMLKISQ